MKKITHHMDGIIPYFEGRVTAEFTEGSGENLSLFSSLDLIDRLEMFEAERRRLLGENAARLFVIQ